MDERVGERATEGVNGSSQGERRLDDAPGLTIGAVLLAIALLTLPAWADDVLASRTQVVAAVGIVAACLVGLLFRRRLAWRSYWLIWILLAAYTTVSDLATGAVPASLGGWGRLLPLNLAQTLTWGLAGRIVIAVASRCPVDEPSLGHWRRMSLQLLGALLAAAVGLVGTWLLAVPFLGTADRARVASAPLVSFRYFTSMYLHLNVLLMLGVLGGSSWWRLRERYRARDLEAMRLESRLVDAQNQALRMQIQPHFLFNTLHSVSALMHRDPDAADRMLSRLADLLRTTLDLGDRQQITLHEETAYVGRYLAIEAIRFDDRLRVSIEIDEECADALVPTFILQPLVENAIKHGLSPLERVVSVRVRAVRDGDWLDLCVEDDGAGYSAGSRQGTGTSTVRSRLQLLYAGRHEFELASRPLAGTVARVRIPWTEEDC